ncbi:hypothetical protein LR48_Vigan01g093200 [Vigna angularis]|uniref:Uncharacterized protein n=1 Tax=Phaseolus angularis TaxID=3914 RepID=A0A0L9TLN8_PHAAN|nr:hypothetical protein LR48_Vigan01g093200 [Vigna angularis]
MVAVAMIEVGLVGVEEVVVKVLVDVVVEVVVERTIRWVRGKAREVSSGRVTMG